MNFISFMIFFKSAKITGESKSCKSDFKSIVTSNEFKPTNKPDMITASSDANIASFS